MTKDGSAFRAGAADRQARVTLSFLADPGDQAMGAALRSRTAAEVLAAVTGADPAGALRLTAAPEDQSMTRALHRWRDRLGQLPSVARLADWQQQGLRLICPGDPEWPTQLDDLGAARPLLLWARGSADVRYSCLRAIAVVGARAATGYGENVGLHLAAAIAERGVTVISGGAKATNSQLMRTMALAFSSWQARARSSRQMRMSFQEQGDNRRWSPASACD